MALDFPSAPLARPILRRCAAGVLTALLAAGCAAAPALTFKQSDDRVRVEIDGKLFTEYLFGKDQRSPIFFPLMGPDEIRMNREWPIKDDVPSEITDHPHHRSLWFSHGEVNGVNFWTDADGNSTIVQEKIEAKADGDSGVIKTHDKWLDPAGKAVLTDEREITLRALPDEAREIDYRVTFIASEGPVDFGDTKEGTLGIRSNSQLQLMTKENGGVPTGAQAVNSEGLKGAMTGEGRRAVSPIYGARAKWIDYWGPVGDGKTTETVGIAMLDSPNNFNYPDHWMARHYGLIAAAPFGNKAYDTPAAPPHSVVAKHLDKGEKLSLAWRIVFHKGDPAEAKIADKFAEWAESEKPGSSKEAKAEAPSK